MCRPCRRVVVAIVLSWIVSALGLNEVTLREACRVEDGFHRCSRSGECRRRATVTGRDCESENFACTNDEFRCHITGKCVHRSNIGTENGCAQDNSNSRLPCRLNEFTCRFSGLCLPRYAVRDGKNDCNTTKIDDFSDELSFLDECISSEIRCQDNSKRCIPREWVLDGYKDCSEGSDELTSLEKCHEDEFKCDNGRCIMRYRVFDGYLDCRNGTDERSPLEGCQRNKEFQCKDSGRCIPRAWTMDGIENCKDRSDEAVDVRCLDGEFHCRDGRRCLPPTLVCDGIHHCGDCSDEIEACAEPTMRRCQGNSSECIPGVYGCNSISDCPDGNALLKYHPGFKCTRNLEDNATECWVPQWSLHDDHSFCSDRSDICFKNGSFTCARCLSNNNIITKGQICNGVVDCQDLTDECLCNSHATNSSIRQLCESVCYSHTTSEACKVCNDRQLYCPDENKCVDFEHVCDGVANCPISKIDENACNYTYRVSFNINSGRCSSVLYERNPFSSPEEMIRNPIFVGIMWVLAVIAIPGNIAVFYKRAKRWKTCNNAKRSGVVLRMNMAISNFGIGVILIIIGAKSSLISGSYCLQETEWRRGSTCQAIGVLITCFSQVSVFTLVVMSCYRTYGFVFPFRARNQLLSISLAWALFIWMSSLVLSIAPFFFGLTQSAVTEVLILPSVYFESTVVSYSDLKVFAERIFTLVPNSVFPQNTSNALDDAYGSLKNLYGDVVPNISAQFGFYNSYGVCTPKLFSVDESIPSLGFTVFLVSMNLFCVMAATVANCALLVILRTRKIGAQTTKFRLDGATKRQIMVTLLTFAYLFSWLGIFAIAISGRHLPATTYSFGSLVLLPLPSALSPLIYTVGFKDVRKVTVLRLKRIRPSKENKVEKSEERGVENKKAVVLHTDVDRRTDL